MPETTNTKKSKLSTKVKGLFKAKKPKFKPEWSREWVVPNNVLEAGSVEVKLQVKAEYPKDRPKADIVVRQEWDKNTVPEIAVPSLKLADKKVVKEKDSKEFDVAFTKENGIWDAFDKLNYTFECTIDKTTTATEKPLKVKRWHVQAIDKNPAEANAQLPFRNQEQANYKSSFASDVDDKYASNAFVAHNTSKEDFGSWIQNTYSFVYTGHGCVICGVCGSPYGSDPGTSDADFGKWTTCPTDATHSQPVSTYCIGGWTPKTNGVRLPVSFFHATHVVDETIVSSAPKYLVFSVACGGAFEKSLYEAFHSRGTRYGIGFEKSTRCDWARDYAKEFFDDWVQTHKCDPDKIPHVFDKLKTKWHVKLRPRLFGRKRAARKKANP